jgi:hypothetical protein
VQKGKVLVSNFSQVYRGAKIRFGQSLFFVMYPAVIPQGRNFIKQFVHCFVAEEAVQNQMGKRTRRYILRVQIFRTLWKLDRTLQEALNL